MRCWQARRRRTGKPSTVVDEVGSARVITSDMDEVAFLRSQIVEIRRRKDALCAERAEHANRRCRSGFDNDLVIRYLDRVVL